VSHSPGTAPAMRVAIVYNEPGAAAQDQDVLVQRDCVTEALVHLGHIAHAIPCSLDLRAANQQLLARPADCVFNLVEALDGTDRLAPLLPLLLESMRLPYTGGRAASLLQCIDKVDVKRQFRSLRLPTPDWLAMDDCHEINAGRYIVKARYEHASIGMDDSAIVEISSAGQLRDLIADRPRQFGFEMFAEAFVDGREFNLSLVASATGDVRALPPAEIDFTAFPANKPRIVGYDAKWTADSFEFQATPRTFDFVAGDAGLLDRLRVIATSVWTAFGLTGYARVDFRVDREGQPLILEINTNPCLSPDAGFQAAVARAGMTFADAIEAILQDARRSTNGIRSGG
jgi:D-alanine-D-alanine ligase